MKINPIIGVQFCNSCYDVLGKIYNEEKDVPTKMQHVTDVCSVSYKYNNVTHPEAVSTHGLCLLPVFIICK